MRRRVGAELACQADVPTLAEAGLKDFDPGTWFGMLALTATPKDIIARLNAEIVKIVASPEFGKRMEDIDAEPVGNTPGKMTRQIRDDTARLARLVNEGKVAIE